MKKYLLVFKLSVQDLFQYKLDFFLNTLKYTMMVLLMSIIWLNVEKEGHVGLLSSSETISYFLISAVLYSLSNFHPWYIEDDIRLGYLSRFLVRPISAHLYYLSFETARLVTETLLKMTIFFGILFSLHLVPDLSFTRVGIFLLYCPFILLFSFQWLSLISILSFWITESYAIRWAVTIFTRLMSGILVPIMYFPEVAQRIFFFLPFEHLAFTPIQFMLGKLNIQTLGMSFLILLGWIAALTLFRQWVWKKGLNEYEGTGI